MNHQQSANATAFTITSPKLGDPCARCRKRSSSMWWVGDGGALAWSHGFAQPWCEVCALQAQLTYALTRARAIPKLAIRLARARRASSSSASSLQSAQRAPLPSRRSEP